MLNRGIGCYSVIDFHSILQPKELTMSDDFFRVVGNIRTLRATLKGVSVEQIKEIAHKMNMIIDEREAEEDKNRIRKEEHDKKIAKIREQLLKQGITPEELLAPDVQKSITDTKPRKKTHKYEYYDDDGNFRTWTGQGRTPRKIQSEIDNNGKTLDDFLIDK